MKYYGTYACGHEGCVNITGPGKDREWKKEREFSKPCPDCYRKQLEEERAAKTAEARKQAQEMELPEISGSPKQAAWAETIRMDVIRALGSEAGDIREKGRKGLHVTGKGGQAYVTLDDLMDIGDILCGKAEARYWIDRRDWHVQEYVEEAYRELEKSRRNPVPDDVREEMEKEEAALTARPEKREKDGIAILSVKGAWITAGYPKDDDFRKTVRDCGYTWDGVWCREVTEYSGPAEDRVAETGRRLLEKGFTVRFPDRRSMELALSGEYQPECRRWVKYNPGKRKLAVTWKGYDDRIYQAAGELPGAKWDRETRSMHVPVEFCDSVLAFADKEGFKISERAGKEIAAFREKAAGFVKADVGKQAPAGDGE